MAMWDVDLTTRAGAETATRMGSIACFIFSGMAVLGVLVGVGLSSTDIVLSLSMIIGGIVESLLGVVAGMLMRSQRGLVLAYIVAALMALELTIKIVTFSLVGIAISGVTMVYLVNGVRGLRALRGGLAFDDEQVDVFS